MIHVNLNHWMKGDRPMFWRLLAKRILLGTLGLVFLAPCAALDLLPKLGAPGSAQPSGLIYSYWLMAEGAPVGFRVRVEINGNKVTTIKKPGEALEVTGHLHLGLNTIRFTAIDEQRRPSGADSASQLVITLGPEYRRQVSGALGNNTSVELREKTVQYVRPFGHRPGGESTVEMRFTLKDDPNPGKLAQKYVLYSGGAFTGHLIQVAVNGIPVVDVASPDFHCDLNPHLVKGANEITFTPTRMEGFPFTGGERQAFGDGGLEVGIATAGEFDPVTFNEPVRQIQPLNQRFVQPGESDSPEKAETLTLIGE